MLAAAYNSDGSEDISVGIAHEQADRSVVNKRHVLNRVLIEVLVEREPGREVVEERKANKGTSGCLIGGKTVKLIVGGGEITNSHVDAPSLAHQAAGSCSGYRDPLDDYLLHAADHDAAVADVARPAGIAGAGPTLLRLTKTIAVDHKVRDPNVPSPARRSAPVSDNHQRAVGAVGQSQAGGGSPTLHGHVAAVDNEWAITDKGASWNLDPTSARGQRVHRLLNGPTVLEILDGALDRRGTGGQMERGQPPE